MVVEQVTVIGGSKPLVSKGALLYMGLRPCIMRSARLTAQTPECPGCFASLRSGQGAAPLAPLCGYPCPLASGKRFSNHSPSASRKIPYHYIVRLPKM